MTGATGHRSLVFAQRALVALAFLSPIVFCPWCYDSVELPKLLITRILMTAALAGALFAFRRDNIWPVSPVGAPILAVLCTAAIATVASVAPRLSLRAYIKSLMLLNVGA